MFSLLVDSSNFPTGGPTGTTSISVTKAKLRWATLTVGRPHKVAVKAFGQYSAYEALFRWNMVRSAIDFDAHPGTAINSELFNALDPTEKGGINFYLGMIFLKLCANDLLHIPWLVHFNWMKANHTLALLQGKSSPDLLGFSPLTHRWSVFEAKGRNAFFSATVMGKAKDQANRLIKVDGNLCSLHVGSQLFRDLDQTLRFTWEDPVADGDRPIELETTRDVWLQYYGIVHQLYIEQMRDRRAFLRRMGFKISLHRKLRALLLALSKPEGRFENELGSLVEWSVIHLKNPEGIWNGDGIGILMGKSG